MKSKNQYLMTNETNDKENKMYTKLINLFYKSILELIL